MEWLMHVVSDNWTIALVSLCTLASVRKLDLHEQKPLRGLAINLENLYEQCKQFEVIVRSPQKIVVMSFYCKAILSVVCLQVLCTCAHAPYRCGLRADGFTQSHHEFMGKHPILLFNMTDDRINFKVIHYIDKLHRPVTVANCKHRARKKLIFLTPNWDPSIGGWWTYPVNSEIGDKRIVPYNLQVAQSHVTKLDGMLLCCSRCNTEPLSQRRALPGTRARRI